MIFEHSSEHQDSIRFSRLDPDSPFSTVSAHPFELEDYLWPSAEHYYQAHKFEGLPYAQTIMSASSGQHAYNLGNRWFKRKVKDWKNKRRVWMTRALYRKVKEYDEIKQALLDTGDQPLLETSLYEHYWGLGRDQRGENTLGNVWMDIRNKVREATFNEE